MDTGTVGEDTFTSTVGDFAVSIPAGAVSAPGPVTVNRRAAGAVAVPDDVAILSDVYEVELDGPELVGDVDVTFTLPDDFDPETTFPIVYWETAAGDGYRGVAATWAPGDETIVAAVDHFSGGFLGGIDLREIAVQWAKNAANYITGRSAVAQPSCGDEDALREELDVISDEGDTVKWCAGIEDGRTIVKVANNRRTYAEVSFPDTWEVLESGKIALSLEAATRWITDGVREFEAGSGTDVRIVAGGDTITFAMPDNSTGRVRVEMSMLAWTLNSLIFAVDVYTGIASKVAAGLGNISESFAEKAMRQLESGADADWIEAGIGCLRGLESSIGETITRPDQSISILKLVWSCLPEMMTAEVLETGYDLFLLGTILSAIGAALGFVLTAANLIVTAVRELFDTIVSFGGKDDVYYDIALGLALPGIFSPSGNAPLVTTGPAVVLVVDTSGSMSERDGLGRVKIEAARQSVLDFIGGVEDDMNLGLRTYPAFGSCDAGRSAFPLAPVDRAATSAIVRTLVPDGGTPTAEALVAAAEELEAAGTSAGTVVLVSDGGSTCEDPCIAAQSIAAGGFDVQVHAIALAADGDAKEELSCIAQSTGGLFAEAGDTDDLQAILDDLTRPQIFLTVDAPRTALATVGTGSGTVPITATITNDSELTARNVRVGIRLDGKAAVASPTRAVGNIDVGKSTSVTWQFRPGLELAGKTISFTVEAGGDNVAENASADGTIAIEDAFGRDDAGPLLEDAEKIVILGDSFSSGEGSGDYIAGTDENGGNTCHRSRNTYLADVFDIPDHAIIACSGAVTSDIVNANGAGIDPQARQLNDWQVEHGPADAVVLTIGGNDFGFKSILLSCIASPVPCDRRVGTTPTNEYIDAHADATAAALPATYRYIDGVLNRPDRVSARGGRAPIIVLAYPRLLPGAGRLCTAINGFAQAELDEGSKLITRLNATVEGAVTGAWGQGVPVFFVADVEDVFLPDHTFCDGDSAYVRTPQTIRLGTDVGTLADYLVAVGGGLFTPSPKSVKIDDLGRRLQELFHPNAGGYEAMGQAVLRWSNSDDAVREFPPPGDPGLLVDTTDGDPLGQIEGLDPITIQGGGTYDLNLQGFAPGSPIEVHLQSTLAVLGTLFATDDGRAVGRITIPAGTPSGSHTVTVIGFDEAGEPRAAGIAVTVDDGSSFPWPLAAGVGVLLLLVVGMLLARPRRRAGASAT